MSSRNTRIVSIAKRSLIALAAGSATAGVVNSAFAQQGGTWTYIGNDVWSNPNVWLNGVTPDGANQPAGFGNGVNSLDTLTVTLDTNRTIGTLQFGDSDGANTPAGWVLKSQAAQVLTLQNDPGSRAFISVAALGAGNGTSQIGTLFQKIAQVSANLAGTNGFVANGLGATAGTLVLSGNNTGLSGEVNLLRGILVLNNANAIGSSTVTLYTGQMAFRGDASTNFGTNITLQNDTTFGVGNSITAGAQYGTGSNQVHTLGNLTVDTYGVRTLGISGSNGYGLTMGRLTLRDGITLINQGNAGSINGAGSNNNVIDAGSGLVTIGTITYGGPGAGTIELGGIGTYAGNITVTNGITNTGGGSAALVYSGSKTLTLNGAIGTNGDTYVTGGTTGSVAGLDYQAGVGTMIANVGALPSGKAVTINGGTLLLNAATTHTIGGLTMGGATLTTGPVPAFLGTGAGTAALAGNIVVNDSILFDTGTTTGSAVATAGSLTGRLDLGGSTRGIAVNGSSTLTVGAVVNGSGGITKTGTGALNLTNINTFTGAINIVDGVVSGTAAAAGNSLGSTGANVSLGGALRVNGLVGVGTATVNTLTSKDSGGNEGLIVDATLGGTTTLTINSYGGRELGTHGTIKVVPVTGQLNTKEIVRLATGAPLPTNGMLPAYFAVQNSGTNSQLNFASVTSNQIVAFNGYSSGTVNINTTGASTVYSQTATEAMTGGRQVFGLKIGANASLTGAQALTLGNGTTGFGGLIMNGGVLVNNGSITTLGTDELVFWSGGTSPNTVASNILFNGDLTTGGSQAIDLSGSLNFNGTTRNLTVTGGTATLSNVAALSSGTAFNKRGGGVLAVTGGNLTNTGTVGIQGGTLQIGAGSIIGGVGAGAIANNAALSLNSAQVGGSFGNAVSGTGNLYVNAAGGDITANGALTYTGDTIVQAGTIRNGAVNRIPVGTNLRVESAGTYDLNGFAQSLNAISGSGTIINNSVAASQATLTVSGSATFDGALRDGAVGQLFLTKTTPGTLVLTSGDSSFSGTISLSGGAALELRDGFAAGVNAGNPTAASPRIVLDNATLIANNTTNRVIRRGIQIVQNTTGTISVLANPNPNTTQFQYVTNASANILGFFNGGGTLVLDLNGRQLDIGVDGGGQQAAFDAFTGTVVFLDSNPVGSKLRWSNSSAGVNTTGNSNATFNFGSGYNTINIRNGTTTFAVGFVSGGTNTLITGCENGAGRTSFVQFGGLPGSQTFAGRVIDAGDPLIGGFSPMGIVKVGVSSSVTLTGANDYTLPTSVQSGTLILGPGGDIRTSSSIDIIPVSATAGAQTSTVQFNGGTISGTGQFLNIGAITSNATQSLSGALLVPNGFVTPGGLTFIGGGTVYGNLEHGAGSINPGTTGGFGTLTFANNLHLIGGPTYSISGGNIDFNVSNGSVNVVGGGFNDLIKVLPNNGLSLDGGTIRVNFASGTANLVSGQYYPLIQFSGTIGGGGTASLQAFAALALVHGSLDIIQGTGSLSNTIGAKVISIGGATANLTWAPLQGNSWDIVTSKNFKPTGGAGSLLFFNTDAVTFDDSTTIRNVVLAASGFQPASMTVNTSNIYDFSQKTVASGSITGPTNFVKNGTGTVIFEMGNDFTGGATINGGWVIQAVPNVTGVTRAPLGTQTITFNNDASYRWFALTANADYGPAGAASAYFNGNNTLFFPSDNAGSQNVNWAFFGNGTVTLDKPAGTTGLMTLNTDLSSFGGTIKITSTSTGGSVRFNSGGGNVNTGGSSVTMDLGQGVIGITHRNAGAPYTFGALRGGPNTQIGFNGAGILTVGAKEDATFDGIITGGATGQVVKVGATTTWTLTNLHTYTGPTLVNAGTLALVSDAGNNLASPLITVSPGATLDVDGLNFGQGLVLNANQALFSNGTIVGPAVQAVSTSTVGGTQINVPLTVADGATISPGASAGSVGSLTVSELTMGAAQFLIEVNQTGIDSLVLSGTQTEPILQSNPGITLVNLGGFVPGTYTFLDYTGNPDIQDGIDNVNSFVFAPFAYEVKLIHDSANTRVLMQFVNNSAQWFVNSNGTWSTPGNWTLDGTNPALIVPNSVTFGTFINAPRTVNVNGATGNVTNSIVFDSPQSYTIAGPGTLTLDSGITAPITVLQGNHAINAPIRALRTLGVSVNPGLTLSFGGTINGQNNAGITKIGTGTASFTQFNLPGGTINVGAGSMLLTQKPAPNSSTGTSLALGLTIAAGAKLNLTNNALILDSANAASVGAQLVELRAELADGRLFSSTTASNTTLGYRSNNTGTTAAAGTGTAGQGLGAVATFAGVGVDNTSVLIRVTYKGDSNLDGVVNVLDLVNLALNWQSTNGVWAGGDFNYDGLVNSSDLAILATGWQLGNNNPLPGDDLGAALTAAGVPLSAVPEPGTLGLVGVGAMGLLARRRRRA